MTQIRIEYIRPGKETTIYIEDLVSMDSACLRTFKVLPPAISASLTPGLISAGLILPDRQVGSIAKTYFFHEHFDLLEFRDKNGNLLGHYSDICTPLVQMHDGFQMTDWFLDIWLHADGTLIELDIDEFEEAISQNLLSSLELDRARTTFARLIEEAKNGIYPQAYLRKP